MLGYGVCLATHAFSAARYAFFEGKYDDKTGARVDYIPRSTNGAVLGCLLFVSPHKVKFMPTNRTPCDSAKMRGDLASKSPVTRWRAEKSLTLVDHDGLWEKEGLDMALLPPTRLGRHGSKVHWLVRNAEMVVKVGCVVPYLYAVLDKKTFPKERWDPNARSTRMV